MLGVSVCLIVIAACLVTDGKISPAGMILFIILGILLCITIIIYFFKIMPSYYFYLGLCSSFNNGEIHRKFFEKISDLFPGIGSSFERLDSLLKEQDTLKLSTRQAEFLALQNQINPHFLYNTLDSLYWKAVEAEDEEIAEDILSLSQMFRLVLNQGDSIVTVKIEAELLERYLHIQKMRFGKRFEFEIQIERSIMEEKIPKLILQPFVENAIVHGFEKGENKFFLSIRGERREDYLYFRIHDTGIGMSSQQMNAIWENGEGGGHSSHRIGKYAIRNVKERMELIYHQDYELTIESEEGRGTTVAISIPGSLGLE